MMFGTGSGMGFGWLWLAGAVAAIGAVVGLILVVRGGSASDESGAILDGRLARGEIDADEYGRRRATLGRSSGRMGTARLGAWLSTVALIALLALGGLTVAGAWPRPGPGSVDPGAPGFVGGTVAAPRIVRIVAGPDLRFHPDVVSVAAGETIAFEVTTMGWTAHEFKVGPAADVGADTAGTPELADIGMMGTKSLTYTFEGPGPFAFACHAPGHYEAGMTGAITIQP